MVQLDNVDELVLYARVTAQLRHPGLKIESFVCNEASWPRQSSGLSSGKSRDVTEREASQVV